MAASRTVHSVPPATLKQAFDAAATCTCLSRSSIAYWELSRVTIFSRYSHFKHKRECPRSAFGQNRRGVVGARVQLGAFLSCILEVTASCSIGAGGYSFSPSVNWKNVVPREKSPVLRKFDRFIFRFSTGRRKLSPKAALAGLLKMQNNVMTLYQHRKSSIYDIDGSGNNHLQVCPPALTF